MALKVGDKAPYAPGATIISLIQKHISTGLPPVIDIGVLERYGVTEALRPRTLASLKQLSFITDDGSLTTEFDMLKRVPAAEVPGYLGELLKDTYALVFDTIGDPATAEQQAIEDAFKSFEPRGQIVRMVQLFLSLMAFTGQIPEDARRKPGPKRLTKPAGQPGDKPKVLVKPKPKPATPPATPPDALHDPVDRRVGGHTARVNLGSAGTVMLMVDVNPLALAKADREAFYLIVDAFNEWAANRTSSGHQSEDDLDKNGAFTS